ncbi:MAG: hypothetical protein ACJ79S_05855 [Gemmatimonadaceae bacterium]
MSAQRLAASLLLLAAAVAAPPLARDACAQRREPTGVAAAAAGEESVAARAWAEALAGAASDGGARTAALLAPRARMAAGRAGMARTDRARWAPAASALLPGAGQAMLDQSRFLPYMAVEAYAWLRYLSDSRDGSRQRSSYRGLARNVARAQFSSSPPVGDWEYYERMEHFIESGVFDAGASDGLQPEPDTMTYNGSVWLLARRTYWADPEVAPDPASSSYASALSFYRQRAVTPPYRWSWRDARLEQDLFRQTIARSNDAYRRAAQDLAVVIANHVLSTVDAYVSVRLAARRSGGGRADSDRGGYGVSVGVPLPAFAAGRGAPGAGARAAIPR